MGNFKLSKSETIQAARQAARKDWPPGDDGIKLAFEAWFSFYMSAGMTTPHDYTRSRAMFFFYFKKERERLLTRTD